MSGVRGGLGDQKQGSGSRARPSAAARQAGHGVDTTRPLASGWQPTCRRSSDRSTLGDKWGSILQTPCLSARVGRVDRRPSDPCLISDHTLLLRRRSSSLCQEEHGRVLHSRSRTPYEVEPRRFRSISRPWASNSCRFLYAAAPPVTKSSPQQNAREGTIWLFRAASWKYRGSDA